MRDDRIPKKRLGPRELNRLRGLASSLMEYNQLVTLQQRLDALENVYSNAHPYDEGILVPRIAKVAPMLAEPKRRDPPVNVQRAPAPPLTVEESIQELSSPEHAAGAPEPTKERANARYAAVECLRSSLYAPKRDTTYPTAYSATSPTDTPTYTTPVNMALHYSSPAFPPYYSMASTSSSSIGSTINSSFATANGATTDRARPSDFQAFCNIYNAYQESNDYQECNDGEMDEQPVPRKMAKRSEQHMTVVRTEFSGSNRGFNGGINGGINGGFNGSFNGGFNGGFNSDHNYASGEGHGYAAASNDDEEMMDCSHFE